MSQKEAEELVQRAPTKAAGAHESRRTSISRAVSIAAAKDKVLMLVPTFRPLVVDQDSSIAASLGGSWWLAELAALTLQAPASSALIWPLSFAMTAAALLGQFPTAPAIAVATTACALSFVRQLAGCIVVCRLVVSTASVVYMLCSAGLVAVAGAAVIDAPDRAALWVLTQSSLMSMVFHDALPTCAVKFTERRLFFPSYAALSVLLAAALFKDVLAIGDIEWELLGGSLKVGQLLGSTQATLAILACRAAFRALSTPDHFVLRDGLRMVHLPPSSVRSLVAASVAIDE
jgi:hypothetical protein